MRKLAEVIATNKKKRAEIEVDAEIGKADTARRNQAPPAAAAGGGTAQISQRLAIEKTKAAARRAPSKA
jgi:hypothetical protein